MDEIDPLIFTATAAAAVVSVATRPHPISHLLIGRLGVRRARVCWYILIDVRWRRLIWQQPAGGSEGEAGGGGAVSDLQFASFDPINLCPGKHFNPIKAIVWKPPYKHCNYANYIKLQICANARARTHLVSRRGAEKWFDCMEDFLCFESEWKWVSQRKLSSWKKKCKYLAPFKIFHIIFGQNVTALKNKVPKQKLRLHVCKSLVSHSDLR